MQDISIIQLPGIFSAMPTVANDDFNQDSFKHLLIESIPPFGTCAIQLLSKRNHTPNLTPVLVNHTNCNCGWIQTSIKLHKLLVRS